jgi:type II secretory pathway pseudopilin PulG
MQRMNKGARRATSGGYSLVEVLVAVAMMGVVLLSIVTLFFAGRRNVYNGKQMSAANAVATRVLEDLSLMSATDIITDFGLTDTTTLASNSVGGVSYAGSVLRDTKGTVNGTTDPSGYLGRWQALVNSQSQFKNGRVVLVITPAQPILNTSPVITAQVVRLRGIVEWQEGVRRRSVTFDASKLQRP